MVKNILLVVISVIFSVLLTVLALPFIVPSPGIAERETQGEADPIKNWTESRERMILDLICEDIEKYGSDIFKLFCDCTQRRNQEVDGDFGADKSFKKLEVSYPESNVYKLAVAWRYNKAILNRDILLVEKALSESPADGSTRLLPNGFELDPILHITMYNYHIHAERYKTALEILNTLEKKYGNSLICVNENKVLFVKDWVGQQKKILNAIEKYNKREAL